jgi:hypothetical protein
MQSVEMIWVNHNNTRLLAYNQFLNLGALGGQRSHSLSIKSRVLRQLSYQRKLSKTGGIEGFHETVH